jgi:hypothetical protein
VKKNGKIKNRKINLKIYIVGRYIELSFFATGSTKGASISTSLLMVSSFLERCTMDFFVS